MPRHTVVPTLCLLLLASAAPAGEKAEKKEAPPPPKPAKIEDPLFELKDGNRFRGQIELESLEVDTEFGVQKIPRARLVRIIFGLSSDPDHLKRLEALVEQLGDSDFEKREKAQEEILAMGLPAKEAVTEALKNKDPEVKSRAEAILKVLQDFPGEAPSKEDKVETPSMTLTGRVKLASFPVRTAYGALQIPRKAIQSIDFRGAPRLKEFSVSPTAQGPQKTLNTGVRLKAGQKIKIKASGSVFLRNYGQPCNPDGLPTNSYGMWNNVPQGALFGRLGPDGPVFKIGADYDEAPGTGILQLGIAGSSPHPMDSGSYKVSVEVIPELGASDEKPSEGKAPADADK
jgi:hypothetical protein